MRIAFVPLLVASTLAAQPSQPPAKTGPIFQNGMAQIVPAFQDTAQWIRQNLWVETDIDSDQDGRRDRVHVDVTRPGQTASEGLKVPVIYSSSPYFAGTARDFSMWDVRQELGVESPKRAPMNGPAYNGGRTRISNALVNTWVPRGFAVVHSEATGTGRSQGCPTVGDTPERMAMKFVIDWLNGRAKGYTSLTGMEEVRATSWSTGKVGMIGTSYEGTLPLAAATTGVDGLEVVIPVAPNTSYYHYYRSNGLVRSPGGYLGEDVDVLYDFVASGDTTVRATCDRLWKNGAFAKGQDRATGDYNEFWAARDLLPHLKNVKAAVLLGHGLNDYNVMPSHSVRIYEALRAMGKPASLFLHQGGHGGNPPADMVNRWFTHYLYGIENGVKSDPTLHVVENIPTPGVPPVRGSFSPVGYPAFPAPGSAPVVLRPTGDGNGIGTLATAGVTAIDTIGDDVAFSGSALASSAQSARRLLYATPVLRDTLRISGTPRITIRVAANKPAANLSVWLVTLPYDSTRLGSQGHVGVVTRGWADPGNYKSLSRGGDYNSLQPGEPLVPGQYYDLTFDLEPDHQVIPPGKQLAVMVMSSDREFTLWPQPGTQLMVDLSRTTFTIPVVGGLDALAKAGGFPTVP
ncbi:MAG TPA: Xaa-Pro dipeptidyl-peptidase [Gemmatimonadaceae bacterium]|nr:Xaa-Pro dipeptidyl-peptidase [Gemmatimonadaceae bacterium]